MAPPPLRTQGSNAANTRTPFDAIEPGPKVIVDSCGVHAVGVDTHLTWFATPFAISQVPDTSKYGVKITYPTDGQMVPVGELTIFGTAAYNATISDCTVYADWNDSQPMEKVMPAGPDYTELGRTDNDYSTWIFSYTEKYHLIGEGTNELTAKLSCDIGPFNSTKYDSVNITGVS